MMIITITIIIIIGSRTMTIMVALKTDAAVKMIDMLANHVVAMSLD